MSFLNELKRRNVLRVGAAYVVAAWLVIQVVETIFPVYGLSDAAIRIVITILAIGLFPTLIFAWAFELTPEGLKKESEVDRGQSITPHTGKKLDRMIMVVLALALAYFSFDKFVLEPQQLASLEEQKNTEVAQARQEGRTEGLVESYGDNSIAVLPFINMSSDVEQEYFSDGISEELLNLLAKIPELRVISRSSAFSFKGKDIEIPEIAKSLNVANILEGSVRKAGNKIRITAQLIEARSDTHLWAETYDRNLDDIFAIQDEIAAAVVEQLKITLLGATPKVGETDPEAYALFLQAQYLRRQGGVESLEQSEDLFLKALAIDPDYVDAWAGLATNYFNKVNQQRLPAAEGYRLAREAVEKALSIDPESGLAHGAFGWLAMRGDNDLSQAAFHFQKALESDPTNAALIANTGTLLALLNRQDEGLVLKKYSAARDPVNPIAHFNLGISYYRLEHWAESIAAFQTALKLSPDMSLAHAYIGANLLFQDKATAALDELVKEKSEQARIMGLALVNYSLGQLDEYRAKLAEFIERWGTERPANVARVYAFAGDADNAFQWLDRAIEMQQSGLSRELVVPLYRKVHSDPRWAEFLQRVGSSPEQLNAIEFQVTLPR